jgi:hypothetical protein
MTGLAEDLIVCRLSGQGHICPCVTGKKEKPMSKRGKDPPWNPLVKEKRNRVKIIPRHNETQ